MANRDLLWQMNAEVEIQDVTAYDMTIFSLSKLVY